MSRAITKKKTAERKTSSRKKSRATKKNSRLRSYLRHHLQMLVASLGYLSRQPVSSLMTSAVIAIALALPAGLYIALDNVSQVSEGWDDTTQISLFLKMDTTIKQADALAKKLRLHKEINKVSIIDRERGLQEFQQISGFGDAIKFLDENPLPHVITVQPIIDQQQPNRVLHLVETLQQERRVELAQLDMQWVKRLYTLLDVARRAVWIIGSLLGLAVLLIVGNTIRLDIQNRRDVIQVSKLIGASNAFIRRPFLYTGMWYGLCGGLLAWLLIAISLGIMAQPLERLATLYQSSYQISSLSAGDISMLILISCLLGLGGSWLAVGRHLSEIEPS
ncbi:MAG: permease-like cell division protein FtsX [Gammaproteobacteria bacterium]|jgi:cell division transport system permease protein